MNSPGHPGELSAAWIERTHGVPTMFDVKASNANGGVGTYTRQETFIKCNRQDVVDAMGMGGGPTAVVINVEDPDTGKTGRFWVSVAIRNGRPEVRVTTQTQADDKSRKIVGTWRDFRDSAQRAAAKRAAKS